MMMRKLSLLVALSLLLTACTGVPLVSAIHDPLYRAETHSSTITVTATESTDGVAEVRIEATVGELTACENQLLLPSLIPCRAGASLLTAVCTYANVKTEV